MKKRISLPDPKAKTKIPDGIDENITENAWLTWDVAFSKELTLEEILLEQPLIEVFLNEYLAHEISVTNKEGNGLFRYIWKQLSKVLNKPSEALKRSSEVSQNFWLYKIEIFIDISITKNLSVPDPPESIIKVPKGYKRGLPGGSSKNTVRLTKPTV